MRKMAINRTQNGKHLINRMVRTLEASLRLFNDFQKQSVGYFFGLLFLSDLIYLMVRCGVPSNLQNLETGYI